MILTVRQGTLPRTEETKLGGCLNSVVKLAAYNVLPTLGYESAVFLGDTQLETRPALDARPEPVVAQPRAYNYILAGRVLCFLALFFLFFLFFFFVLIGCLFFMLLLLYGSGLCRRYTLWIVIRDDDSRSGG